MPPDDFEAAKLDALWAEARDSWRRRNVDVDRFLSDKASDRRRGLSLILRPGPAALDAAESQARVLALLAGNVYVYPRADLHVTLLTLISGHESFDLESANVDRYASAVEAALDGAGAFDLRFQGVSASPAALYLKAFSEGTINRLRDALRAGLSEAGLGGPLDKRYRSETSHVTFLRFAAPVPDVEALIAAVEARAQADFGAARAARLELVANDWYMSSEKTTVLREFPLRED